MGEPYVKVPLSVVHAKLSPEAKWMLVLLANHRNMNGDSFLTKSITWYKDSLNLTEWEVRRALKELEENGLIDKKTGRTNSYRLSKFNEMYPENTTGYSENTTGYSENISGTYTSIYKRKYKKENSKLISKSARAREREEMQYSPDLFKRRAD